MLKGLHRLENLIVDTLNEMQLKGVSWANRTNLVMHNIIPF